MHVQVSSSVILCIIPLTQGHLVNLELHGFWLDWWPASLSNSVFPHPLVLGLQVHVATHSSLRGCWGLELKSSCLCSKHSYEVSPLISYYHYYYYFAGEAIFP